MIGRDYALYTGVTSPTLKERMRVTQAGLMGVGVSSPSYALDVSGTVRATAFIGNGSQITNLPVALTDRIISGTTSITAQSGGVVSITTNGTTANYFNASGLLITPGISVTTANGISSTNGYFSRNVGIGVEPSTYGFQLVGDGGGTDDMTLDAYTDTASNSPLVQIRRARGTSTAATAPQANDMLGVVRFAGYNGSSFTNVAAIYGYAEGDFSVSATRSSSLRFSTTNAGSFAERMRISPNGNIGIGTTTPKATLEVSGSISLGSGALYLPYKAGSDSLATSYASLKAAVGADSSLLSLTDATDVGLSNQETVLMLADNEVNNDDGFSIVRWNNSGFHSTPFRLRGNGYIGLNGILNAAYPLDVSGTVRATTFIGDGSGLTNLTGDNLGNHTATQNIGLGSNAIVFGNSIVDKIYLYSNTYGIGMESSNLTNWSGSSFRWRVGGTSASTGTQVMALNTAGLTVSGSILVNNTGDLATAPSYSWSGDTNTGMYWVGNDQIGVTTGGTQRALINSSGITVTGRVSTTGLIDAGGAIYGYQGDSVTAPGYTWSGDTNTGMYWVGADQIGLTVGGVQQLLIKTTGLTISGSVLVNNVGDTAAAPSYSWSGDTNTGFYWVGSDQIGVSTGSGQRLLVNSSGLRVTGAINTVGGNITVDGAVTASDGVSIGNGSFVLSGNRDITSAIAGGQIFIQDSITSNSGSKLRIDVNELQAQVDGGAGAYTINPFGGQVNIGSSNGSSLLRVVGASVTCSIGNGTGTTACSSDRRLKKDIRPLENSLEKIASLQGVHFKWKKAPSKTRIGLIAQDVEKQFPEVVETDPETGMKSVAYPSLVAPLVEAVKQLKADNDSLRKTVEEQGRAIRALQSEQSH